MIEKHKTARDGKAALAFTYPGLYETCKSYKNKFRQDVEDPEKDTLFVTELGNPERPWKGLELVKKMFMPDLTEMESKNLKMEAWRKLWATWGSSHSDKNVREICLKYMAHKESTRDKYYVVHNPTFGIDCIKQIMQDVAFKDPLEEGEGDPEDEAGGNIKRKPNTDGRNHRGKKIHLDNSKLSAGPKACTFTTFEKKFVRKLFEVDGNPPANISGPDIEAKRTDIGFNKIYKRLTNQKEADRGSSTAPVKARVYQVIRKCAKGTG